MINLRQIHKEYLVSILSTITFDTKALPVYAGHKVSTDVPYIFISSSQAGYESSNNMMFDNATYYRKLSYNLNLVTILSEDETQNAILESSMDELEQLIMAKLENLDVRNCIVANGQNPWSELILSGVSAPFGGENINLDQGTVVKTFMVDIYHLVPAT